MEKEIVFIRHGTARKRKVTPKGDIMAFVHDEMSRELTSEGRQGVPSLGEFDLVIASPATRAIQTAMIASGRNPDKIITSLSTHLWPAEAGDNDWKLVEKIFVYLRGGKDKKSLVSLGEAYAGASPTELRACKRISCQSVDEIRSLMNGSKRILVAGHMLHLQATVIEMFNKNIMAETAKKTQSRIMDVILDKGESFVINF